MIERFFSAADQERFAAWSGDRNPLHMQPDWAATVYPGQVVVHGMHLVLSLLEAGPQPGRPLAHLAVAFVRPVLLGDQVTGRVSDTDSGAVIMALVRDKVVARIDLRFGERVAAVAPAAPTAPPASARVRDLESLPNARGQVPMPAAAPLAAAFPRLADAVGEAALCGLACLSTLVGMECPGLWSVFAELAVDFAPAEGPLNYRVSEINRRFSRATMEVSGCGLAGRVVASVVPAETAEDEGADDLASLVQAGEFAGLAPLLVGAGPGLGAVAARLLAAGGARPVVTVHRSTAAGERLCRRIAEAGGHCDLLRLDVTRPAEGLAALAGLGCHGESLLYFASPRIFRRRLETFQAADLADFTAIYVDAFYELLRGVVAQRGRAPLKVFYPSSVAVETQPPEMLEYALAKQAGEGLCRVLGREFPGVSTLVERLPRTDSRQTRGFVKAAAARPADVMLPILRRMKA